MSSQITKKKFEPEKSSQKILSSETSKWIESMGLDSEKMYQMMRLITSENMDLKNMSLDGMKKSGYEPKYVFVAKFFKKNNEEFSISEKDKVLCQNYVAPHLNISKEKFTPKTYAWVVKEMKNNPAFDLTSFEKKYTTKINDKVSTNEKLIAQFRGETKKIKNVPVRSDEKVIVDSKKKETDKVEQSEVKKEVTQLVKEAEKELTLFEKLYGPQATAETRKKLFGEEWASKAEAKKKSEVADKKKEKKEEKETNLEKNTREIREMRMAQMEKDAKRVEEEKAKRKRKGDEISQTGVKEDMSKITEEQIKNWKTKDIEALTLEQLKKLNEQQLAALQTNENVNKVNDETKKKIYALFE